TDCTAVQIYFRKALSFSPLSSPSLGAITTVLPLATFSVSRSPSAIAAFSSGLSESSLKYASDMYLTFNTLPGLSAISVSVQLPFFQMYVRPAAVRTGSRESALSASFMPLVALDTSIAILPSDLFIMSAGGTVAVAGGDSIGFGELFPGAFSA